MYANEIRTAIENKKTRGAWAAGVKEYALEMLDALPGNVDYGSAASIECDLLNGADNWEHYSWSGCALCFDFDIANRLCNQTEWRKTRGGELDPNPNEKWLDVQARALFQACKLITNAID